MTLQGENRRSSGFMLRKMEIPPECMIYVHQMLSKIENGVLTVYLPCDDDGIKQEL